jgi:hypothetical protein
VLGARWAHVPPRQRLRQAGARSGICCWITPTALSKRCTHRCVHSDSSARNRGSVPLGPLGAAFVLQAHLSMALKLSGSSISYCSSVLRAEAAARLLRGPVPPTAPRLCERRRWRFEAPASWSAAAHSSAISSTAAWAAVRARCPRDILTAAAIWLNFTIFNRTVTLQEVAGVSRTRQSARTGPGFDWNGCVAVRGARPAF